jgi:hypothetical protein
VKDVYAIDPAAMRLVSYVVLVGFAASVILVVYGLAKFVGVF